MNIIKTIYYWLLNKGWIKPTERACYLLRHTDWSIQEETQLCEMKRYDVKIEVISMILGRSIAACRMKLSRISCKR